LFAPEGYNLVLVARTQARLEDLARQFALNYAIKVLVEPADLSKRGQLRN
jgi:short-subunit dehydrogenase